MVADRHRRAGYHNKHCPRAFRGYQHRWPWTILNPENMGFKWFFCYFRLWRTLKSEFSLKYTGDRPRQPAYEIIKLMLSRVPWALAQISCLSHLKHGHEDSLPLHLDVRSSETFQHQGALPPYQGLCPWTLLGAQPSEPRYRFKLRAPLHFFIQV